MSKETYNISQNYFNEYSEIRNRSDVHIANFYATAIPNAIGTIYFFHGYGGSPIERILLDGMKIAMENEFNVVAIESVKLSATAPGVRNLSEMTLDNHKDAFNAGLVYAASRPEFYTSKNIEFSHSLGSLALGRLSVESKFVRNFFDYDIVVNPYNLPQRKLNEMRDKFKTNGMWYKERVMKRKIAGMEWSVPRSMQSLHIGLPRCRGWNMPITNLDSIVRRAGASLRNRNVDFILGASDDLTEREINEKIFELLPMQSKSIKIIPYADHWMETKDSELNDVVHRYYINAVYDVIWTIRDELLHKQK